MFSCTKENFPPSRKPPPTVSYSIKFSCTPRHQPILSRCFEYNLDFRTGVAKGLQEAGMKSKFSSFRHSNQFYDPDTKVSHKEFEQLSGKFIDPSPQVPSFEEISLVGCTIEDVLMQTAVKRHIRKLNALALPTGVVLFCSCRKMTCFA